MIYEDSTGDIKDCRSLAGAFRSAYAVNVSGTLGGMEIVNDSIVDIGGGSKYLSCSE